MQLSNITDRLNLVERSFLNDLIKGYSDDSEAPRNPDNWTPKEWLGFANFLRVPSGFTDEDEEACQRFADMIDGRP